jgi:5-enolpyruvylshikimate-3-phosphate synthase
LIEVVVIASASFLIVVAAISASIRVAIHGTELQEAARSGAVHAARHGDLESARSMAEALYPGIEISAKRIDDRVVTVATALLDLPHSDGKARIGVTGRAEMPLAPFRSNRG